MKVSVSTAFFGRISPELVHLYSEARIDAMETAAPNAFSLEKYDFKGVADECRACGVEWRSAHLPFGSEVALAHLDRKIRESSLEIDKKVVDLLAGLGVGRFVIHPSTEPNEDADRPELLRYCEDALTRLCEFARPYGVKIMMENLPRTCLCNTSAEAIDMLRRVPELYHCFDMNHFLPWKGVRPDNVEHIYAVKREVGDRLESTHASDYDFIDERHQFPMDGDNDWAGIMRALRETGYKGYFNYEIGYAHGAGEGKTLCDVRENFDKLMSL